MFVLKRSSLLGVWGVMVWAATTAGAATTEDWPMFGRNKEHHGRSLENVIGAANASSLKLAWRTNTGAAVQSSPVVAFNAIRGRRLVYIGNSVGLVQAFDAITGVRVWTYNAGYNVNSTPAVYNGTVYITSESRVIALDGATGAESAFSTAPESSSHLLLWWILMMPAWQWDSLRIQSGIHGPKSRPSEASYSGKPDSGIIRRHRPLRISSSS